MGDRYYLRYQGETNYREVTKEQYVNAERAAGFYNTLGQPFEPATSAFGSAAGTHGRIEYGMSEAGR